MQIHERLMNVFYQALLETIRKARFTIDGVERDFDIFRTERMGNILRVMFYLDDYSGPVTHATLLDKDNVILISGTTNFHKENDGFMYVFDIPIIHEGGVAP